MMKTTESHPLWYALAFIFPLSTSLGIALQGPWTFLAPLWMFVAVPVLDEWLGDYKVNFDADTEASERDKRVYRVITQLWVPIQISVLAWGLWALVTLPLAGWETVGLVASLGILGATGINVSHELMHRPNRWSKALAEINLTAVSYAHFSVEHIHGHHKFVATEKDPATARYGDNVFGFIPRSVLGGIGSYWHLEGRIVARKKTAWTLADRRVRYPLVMALVLGSIGGLLGLNAVGYFLAQSITAIALLEVVNFLEHYGLSRGHNGTKHERVQPHHSWNSARWFSNRLLFGLPRHSDHHFQAYRPYPILKHHAQAPQLPAGYPVMLLIALCPPLWRRIMDPRVRAMQALDSQ